MIEKLEAGQIQNFEQLRRQVGAELIKHKGMSSSAPVEQISYTTIGINSPQIATNSSTNHVKTVTDKNLED